MSASLEANLPARYVVGIDLGTTNSALNYVDTTESPWRVQVLRIPQLIAPGEVELRETLPSFHFQPAPGEMPGASLSLPWDTTPPTMAVGWMARDHSAGSHGRVIASAKSWLCHAGVDRRAPILPWHAVDESIQISPVEASARYLRHLRKAWDHTFPAAPLAEQEVVITLPASFDEIARELTVQAAHQAGLPQITLIEEPQAAFYAWVDQHRDQWHELVHLGQNILVIDVGGGTTDLTLIRVRRREGASGPEVQFHRVAVGDHLILGGDNLDLALAHHVEQSLGRSLEPRPWEHLLRQCRRAKEVMLGDDPPESLTIHWPGSGSRLVGGGMQATVTQKEVSAWLLDGFFPFTALTDDPQSTQSGFQEFSLPYASDAAVTRYLAKFLRDHATPELGCRCGNVDAVRPDMVLFNGGVFSSPAIRARVVQVIGRWFSTDQTPWQPQLLQNARLDQAVAQGAAYFGMVRRGEGERIAAGLARTYYVGIQGAPGSPARAVCLIPGTAEPGDSLQLTEPRLDLLVSQPAEFPLYVSSTRLADQPGTLHAIDGEQMKPLAPIRTALQSAGRKKADVVPVHLRADLTEIGTLELWCLSAIDDRQWRLQFDVRSAVATHLSSQSTHGESQGVWEESRWDSLAELLAGTFGPAGTDKPASLIDRLTVAIGLPRGEWPMPLLRRMWETLLLHQTGRRKSAAHETRWLNLLGFALRPGYGMAVDDWRVAETWRILQGKLVHGTPACRNELWILWRRIAGGMTANQQKGLAEPYVAALRAARKRWLGGAAGPASDPGFQPYEAGELYRLLASLEWLARGVKLDLGNLLLALLKKSFTMSGKWDPLLGPVLWSLGRLGSRVPLYGPLNMVLEMDHVEAWIRQIQSAPWKDHATQSAAALAIVQMARRTGDRRRDLAEGLRQELGAWLATQSVPESWRALVLQGGSMDVETEREVWGDALPPGLQLSST